ncbi:MAG TPA: hypothetical protein VFR62_12315 [Gemmatimonadales bacterium]|nr:hypothetical protein [Gemmatimonadales bacterium]
MRRALFLSFALTLALGAKAAAQSCTGMPSFSAGKMQVTAGGSFADGTSSFGGTFGYGQPKSFYGKAALGSTSYDGIDGSSLDFGVSGGYQIALKSSRPIEVCPVASLTIGSGPNDVLPGVDMSSRTFTMGAALGAQLGNNPQLQIVPNASFQFANTRLSMDDGSDSVSGSESYGLLTLGTGFIFNSRYSLNPSISLPMGYDGSDASFTLAGAIHFGH